MLGNRIKKLREELNMSQSQLADKIGISLPAISHYETGRREPDSEIIEKLANFFDVTTDYLYGRTDKKNIYVYTYDDEKALIDSEDKELLSNIAKDIDNPVNKALYSKISEIKDDKDKKQIYDIIKTFTDEVDNQKE